VLLYLNRAFVHGESNTKVACNSSAGLLHWGHFLTRLQRKLNADTHT